jgi:SAM-dependent methyltransferase
MDDMARAATLPQADASTLVDAAELEAKVQEMYEHVAREDEAALHFEVGRPVMERLGYPEALLDAIPPAAMASFAGVGHHLDLAQLEPGLDVLDLGSGSGADVFCAALRVGPRGSVTGVDFTRAQLDKACALTDAANIHFVEARIDDLPFADASFDVVISNGVINLSIAKQRVFAEAARVLRPGGRLALSDIVSGKPLKERTRRNTDLWAACIAGAIPLGDYVEAIEQAGFAVQTIRRNDYAFVSDRALEACSTYAVESVALAAVRS